MKDYCIMRMVVNRKEIDMSEKIKSALEKALERAAAMPEVTQDSLASIEYVPQGKGIAASYMNEEDFDLNGAISEFPSDIKKHILTGVQEVLIANIVLPGNETALENDYKAMEGIMAIKKDKPSAGQLLSELDNFLRYYQQVMSQAMDKFKKEYEMRVKNNPAQNEKEMAAERIEFQQEWAQVVRQIDHQFGARLAEFKERIKQVS
jgi:hypothetical protein